MRLVIKETKTTVVRAEISRLGTDRRIGNQFQEARMLKGKQNRQRAASVVEYRLEAGAVDYQFEMEEEILMQHIGLDRFLSVVSWDHNNPRVVAEVIEHLEGTTYESRLNGRVIKKFQED